MRLAIALALTLVLPACGGGQTRVGSAFSTDWRDDNGASARRIQARVLATPIPAGVPAAVGVTDSGLVGVPLAGGQRWTFAHALDARPQIAGSVVVGTGGGELFALDAQSGRPLWVKRSAGALHGIGDDGKTTVITLGGVGDSGSIVLAVGHDGTVIRQVEAAPMLGIPAVVGRYAFLPWQGQYVTIYNLATSEEEARLLFREQVSRAFTHQGKLYFGELGLFRFDEQIALASLQGASHVAMPLTDLPGNPKWWRSGAERRAPSADARDRIALFAEPAPTAKLGLDGNRVVATYYRLSVGFDSETRAIAWADRHPTDWLAGATFGGGVALCDADGNIALLNAATGAKVGGASLGTKIEACVLNADGLPRAREGTGTRPSVAEQLARAIDPADGDLIAMHRVLVRALAKLEDAGATQALVALASDPRASPALLADLDPALASRRNGAESMLAALARHYDFLKDELRPPPVGPLADALAAMKDRRAAPLLVSHLFDTADSTNAVKRAAAALVEVGTPAELPDLRTFFSLYRASAVNDDLADAVMSVGRALLKLGTPEDRTMVAQAAEDPLTAKPIQTQLAAMLK